MKRWIGLLALAVVGCARSGTDNSSGNSPVPSARPPRAEASHPIAAPASTRAVAPRTPSYAGNAFAVELYERLGKHDGNLVFSPAALAQSLGTVFAGATGETAAQMGGVLHLDAQKDAREQARGLLAAWPAEKDKSKPALRWASRVWVDRSVPLAEESKSLLPGPHAPSVEQVDFLRSPDAARGTINTWASGATNEAIPELVAKGAMSPESRLLAASAAAFRGLWASPFDPARTRPATFKVSQGQELQVPMMNQIGSFVFAELDTVRIVALPCEGSELSFAIVLPRKEDGLALVEAQVRAGKLDPWLGMGWAQPVEVSLPRFRLRSALPSLREDLTALGMGIAFDPKAGFNGIAKEPARVPLSGVVHQAYVEVGEGPARGPSVASAKNPGGSAAGPPSFVANRPFLFVVRNRQNGAILLLGRVVRPEP